MEFRFMKGRGVSPLPIKAVAISRNLGMGAVFCALLGTAAHAQATLDFLDPLETERQRIEQNADPDARPAVPQELPPPRLGNVPGPDSVLTRTRDGASVAAGVVKDGASGFWGTVRTTLSSIAAALGLPVTGLIALMGLLLAGLAALVGWTLFKGRGRGRKRRPAVASTSGDVYARSSKDKAKRRILGGAIPGRARTEQEEPDNPETEFEETEFEETMPEDFDSIFADETDEPAKDRAPAEKTDTDKWRKPNLDRLRDSIKADWRAEKEEKVRDKSAIPAAPRRDTAPTDPATRTLGDLSDGWEEWDTQDNPGDDPWDEAAPSREAAAVKEDDHKTSMNRIRALRDSLRAS